MRAGPDPDRVQAGHPQAQQLVRAAPCDFHGFYASRPAPPARLGEVLVLSCDAEGIRMRPGQLRPRAERLARKAVLQQDEQAVPGRGPHP